MTPLEQFLTRVVSSEDRDRLADKRSRRQCTTGQKDLDSAISWYLKIGFEDGYDSRQADIETLVEMLKKTLYYVEGDATWEGLCRQLNQLAEKRMKERG